jgi:DNA processing protein
MEADEGYDQAEFDWVSAQQDIEKAKQALSDLLSPTPTPRDEIIRLSEFSVAIATAALLEMELNGDIMVEADGRVALNVDF